MLSGAYGSTYWKKLRSNFMGKNGNLGKPSRWVAKLFQGVQAQGKSGLCSNSLLATTSKWSPWVLATWTGPDRVEPWKWPKSCEEGEAAKHRTWVGRSWFESWRQQGSFTAESLLKLTLLLVICTHIFNSCVRCIVWLYICFSFERCNMNSINKRSTREVANFNRKKLWLLSEEEKTPQTTLPWPGFELTISASRLGSSIL